MSSITDVSEVDRTIPTAPDTTTLPAPSKRTRNMPNYGVSVVDELPDNEKGGRSKLYYELLSDVAENPGSWCEVAHFQTPTGARSALKALEKGDRVVPDGEWEFEIRKVRNPNDAMGPKHSKLYARLVG